MIHMADDNPTIEDLQKQIDRLESELDEAMAVVNEINMIKRACRHMGQKLADENGDALADWWWLV